MQIRYDQSYGPHPLQRADVFTPSGKQPRTVVIFWHGGSWQRGNKKTYGFVGRALAKLGYVAVVPNYRLYPDVAWPVFAEDAALVVAWSRTTFMPTKVVAMGHSAGGQIAAAISYDGRYLAEAGVPDGVDGFVGVAPAADFVPARSLKPILEAIDRPWKAPELLSAKTPIPTLLIHGGSDAIITIGHSRRLAKSLRDHGGRVQTVFYPGLSHFTILAPFILSWLGFGGLKRKFGNFVDSL